MPEQIQKPNRYKNPKKRNKNLVSTFFRATKQSEQTITKQENSDKEASASQQEIKKETVSKKDVIAIVIDAVLAVFTILLFFQTIKATDAAVSSAETARLAVAHQVENDNLSKIEKRVQAIRDSINNIKRLQHDSSVLGEQRRSIGAQIGQLSELQKEFEIENKPYLQVVDVTLDSLAIGNEIQI